MIHEGHEFHLMTVVLKPDRYGLIDTYVKLSLKTEYDSVHKVNLPIIGLVVPNH